MAAGLFFHPKESHQRGTGRMINFPWSGERHFHALSSTSPFVAMTTPGYVQLWDVSQLPEKKQDRPSEIPALSYLQHPSALTAISLEEVKIATASKDTVIVWDEKQQKQNEFKLGLEDCSKIHLHPLPDQQHLVAVGLGRKNEVGLVDLKQDQQPKKVTLSEHVRGVSFIAPDYLITVEPAIGLRLHKLNLQADKLLLETVKTFPMQNVSSILVLPNNMLAIVQNNSLHLWEFDEKNLALKNNMLIADKVHSTPEPICVAGKILFAPRHANSFRATLVESHDLATHQNSVALGPTKDGITSIAPTTRGLVAQFDVTPLVGLYPFAPLQKELQKQETSHPAQHI